MLLVYHFRHWIKQLCLAIECEYRKQKQDDSWTLYSGFQLHEDEFERLKNSIGSLISVNSFLSTSRDINVARIFAGVGVIEDRLVRVLLEIQANPASLQSVFFADISHISQFRDEEEVLFSLGSTFRIFSIDFDENSQHWIVQLNATDDGSDRIQQYRQLADYGFHSTSPMIYFGTVLNENLDQTDRAVRYFRELVEFVGKTHPDLWQIYDALGDVYARRKEINQSVKCYKIEQKLRRKHGIVSSKSNEKIQDVLQARLEEEEKRTNEPSLDKANLLRELAEYSNYAQAEIYLNQALQIYEQLKLASPLVSSCVDELAWIYRKGGNDQKHLDLCYRRLAIEEEYLPVDNQTLCETLKDILNAVITPDNYRQFIDFCQRKMSILIESLGENHLRISHMRTCMEEVEDKLEDFEENQTEWIEGLQSINEKDLYQRCKFYNRLSMFYFRYGLYNESVQYSLIELEICQNIPGYALKEIIRIFDDIALRYQRMFDYSQAFVYMKKVFELSQSIEPYNPEIVENIQNRIDNFVRSAARRHIELPWIPLSEADDDIPW